MRAWIPILLLLQSCGSAGYLVKQGLGQLKIQWRGEDNGKVIADPTVPEETKFKIRLVEDAKRFFAHHFEMDVGGIYSKTTRLDGEAVSWLVVASRPDRVEAHEFDFPFVGKFPYIGFFEKDDAQSFRERLERDEGLVTWMRPVYAYSTLGYLQDRILSSFFHFKDAELVELTFHELFHVAFFAKDDVELNENLAQWFADALLDDYFKDAGMLAEYRLHQQREKALEQRLVGLAQLLRSEFDKMRPNLTAERASAHTRRFVAEILVPSVRLVCEEYGWTGKDCPDREAKWNQASLAALLTYEEKQDFIRALVAKHGFTPKEFLRHLRQWHAEWEKKGEGDFSAFLQQKT